jgi:hypothetical protein
MRTVLAFATRSLIGVVNVTLVAYGVEPPSVVGRMSLTFVMPVFVPLPDVRCVVVKVMKRS